MNYDKQKQLCHRIDEDRAYYAIKPAWHGVGTVTKEAKTSTEVITLAGMDYNVYQEQAFCNVQGEPVEIPNRFANIRGDNHRVLGVVSDRYQIVQNSDAFDFVDSLVETGEVYYESAGILEEGRKVWLLARLDNSHNMEVVEGDEQRPYLLFTNSHDGSAAIRVLPTSIRVVCWNTLSMALNAGKKEGVSIDQFSIRHTGDIQAKVAEARKILGLVVEGNKAYIDTARALAEAQVSDNQVKDYFTELFGEINPSDSARKITTMRDIVNDAMNRFKKGKAQQIPGVKGSAWGLVNAITEHVDHRKYRADVTNERKFDRMLSGDLAKFKLEAFQLATNMFV